MSSSDPRALAHDAPQEAPLHDRSGRPLRDLRISVTDRCNFRCRYCMPRERFGSNFPFLRRQDILSFEEIVRLSRLFVARGVTKLRLTGGEPLLRKDLPRLVEMLGRLGAELALTTNGALLARHARALASAGLDRVTVSLDALDEAVFQRMSDAPRFHVTDVLAGIEAARIAGLGPIKVNCVVRRGVNEDQIEPLVRHFRGSGCTVRFIEFMDVGSTNGWRLDEVASGREILRRLSALAELEPLQPTTPGEVARRYRFADGGDEIGVITSVTEPFCGACSRARLSANGQLYTCLFATQGTDLLGPLRAGESDAQLDARITTVWRAREDRYSEQRAEAVGPRDPRRLPTVQSRVEMSYIGG